MSHNFANDAFSVGSPPLLLFEAFADHVIVWIIGRHNFALTRQIDFTIKIRAIQKEGCQFTLGNDRNIRFCVQTKCSQAKDCTDEEFVNFKQTCDWPICPM